MSMAVLAVHATQTITLVPGPLPGGFTFVGCQVNGPSPGNNINNTSFLQVPASVNSFTVLSMVVWDCTEFRTYYYYDAADAAPQPAGWYDGVGNFADVTWTPGEGVVFDNNSAVPITLTLNGTDVTTPVLPPANYCGCGAWSFFSAQTPSSGITTYTYQQVTGFAPQTGAEVAFSNSISLNYPANGIVPSAIYVNGSWTPATPLLTNNQAAFFFIPCPMTNCGPCLQVSNPPSSMNLYECTLAPVQFQTPVFTDACCSNVSVVFTPPSGTTFSYGVTPVTCVVSDSCGNTNTYDFTVNVIFPPWQVCPSAIGGIGYLTNPFTMGTSTIGGSNMAIFWVPSGSNSILESTTNLASPNWVPVTSYVPLNGAVVPNNLPAQFYRIYSPTN